LQKPKTVISSGNLNITRQICSGGPAIINNAIPYDRHRFMSSRYIMYVRPSFFKSDEINLFKNAILNLSLKSILCYKIYFTSKNALQVDFK